MEEPSVGKEVAADEEKPEWANNGVAGSSTRGAGKRKVATNKYNSQFWHH